MVEEKPRELLERTDERAKRDLAGEGETLGRKVERRLGHLRHQLADLMQQAAEKLVGDG
jgi:F0F1-type ATP synthase membrane subunit b/b'